MRDGMPVCSPCCRRAGEERQGDGVAHRCQPKQMPWIPDWSFSSLTSATRLPHVSPNYDTCCCDWSLPLLYLQWRIKRVAQGCAPPVFGEDLHIFNVKFVQKVVGESFFLKILESVMLKHKVGSPVSNQEEIIHLILPFRSSYVLKPPAKPVASV